MSDFARSGDTPPLDWNGPVDHPFRPMTPDFIERPVFEVFREVAQRWEGRPAVHDHQGETTYGHLLTLALAVAITLGDTDEQSPLVGIALPADHRFPAAMLGVLAAGRAYVPLDLNQPAERLAHIVSHSGLTTVLACGDTLNAIVAAVPRECRVIDVDLLGPASPTFQPVGTPNDVAYLLYTSGSTGQPKGVYQNERGLMHDVMQYTNSVHFSQLDVTSGIYSPGVNGAIRDIYGALLNGGCLCMVDLRRDGYTVASARMAQAGITIFHAMPPVLRSLLSDVHDRSMMQQVRLAYVAGDRFWGSDVRLLRDALPDDALLYTGIGSTECATLYRQWFVPPDWPVHEGLIPVGCAVPDREVRLVGDQGLIEVTSAYLARGYWNDAELTEQVFTSSGGDPQQVTFHTGDRGQLRPDGLLEFVGRADRQVKIRGYRVEVAEIETVLRSVDGVTDAAVVARGEGESCHLVALVEAGDAQVTSRTVASVLEGRLPAYMRPTSTVVMPSLPRLGNGKLDTQRLGVLADQSLASVAAGTPSADVPSDDEVLTRVVAEWTRLLGVAAAGEDDSWTASGGDSLMALELIVALESSFGVVLPADLVSDDATPATLSVLVRSWLDPATASDESRAEVGAFFIVPWAPGASIHDRRLAEALRSHFRVEILPLTTLDDELKRVHSIPDLARESVAFITASTPVETPIFLVGVSFGGRVAVELAWQLRVQGREVAMVGVGDIASDGGYQLLSRRAWAAWAQSGSDAARWLRVTRHMQAQMRVGVGWTIRSMARLSWQAPFRATTRAGVAVFGDSFRGGALAAIRQSQVPSWQIPDYPGELVLFLTDDTATLLSDAGPTLGWEQHAKSVRVVPLEGHHTEFHGEEYGPAFAQRVLAVALESAQAPRT